MPEVLVDIHDRKPHYVPGDTIQGEVVVRLDKPMRCRYVRAKLQRFVCIPRGSHENLPPAFETKDIEVTPFSIGKMPAGEHRFPFTFTLPAGPYSYRGRHLEMDWGVEGELDVRVFKRITHREAFTLSNSALSEHVTEQIEPCPKVYNGMAGILRLVIGVLLALSGGSLLSIALFARQDDLVMPGLIAGGLAAIFIIWGIRALRVSMNFMPEVSLSPWPPRPGQSMLYVMTFTPDTDLEIESLTLALEGREHAYHKGSFAYKGRRWRHDILHTPCTLLVKDIYPEGVPARISHRIDLPDSVPASFEFGWNNRVEWTLEMHATFARRASWRRTIHIPVAAKRIT